MARFRVTSRQVSSEGTRRSVTLECTDASIPEPEDIDAGREILARFNGFALLLNEGDRIVLVPEDTL